MTVFEDFRPMQSTQIFTVLPLIMDHKTLPSPPTFSIRAVHILAGTLYPEKQPSACKCTLSCGSCSNLAYTTA